MLKRTIKKVNDSMDIVEIEQSLLSFHDTKITYFYKVRYGEDWINVATAAAERMTDQEVIERLDSYTSTVLTDTELCWLNKYHLPAATRI